MEPESKLCNNFGLTLSQSTLDKWHVFYTLEGLCDSVLVSREVHEDGGYHYHAYLHTKEKDRITGIRDHLATTFYGDQTPESIKIETLRNADRWIKYCTKEDCDPIYVGMDSSKFHQSWKINSYIRGNESFNPMDPFIRQNPQLSNIIYKMHTHYWNRKYAAHIPTLPVRIDQTVDWANRAIKNILEKSHMILSGKSGVGKTALLREFCEGQVAWLPCGDTTFEFSQVSSTTTFVIAGDAPENYLRKHRSTLLQIADRHITSINEKCGPIKAVAFRGAVIIVTNYDWWEQYVQDEAIRRRYDYIICNEKAWVPRARIKVEVPEEVPEGETIYISSEEEDKENEEPSKGGSDTSKVHLQHDYGYQLGGRQPGMSNIRPQSSGGQGGSRVRETLRRIQGVSNQGQVHPEMDECQLDRE